MKTIPTKQQMEDERREARLALKINAGMLADWQRREEMAETRREAERRKIGEAERRIKEITEDERAAPERIKAIEEKIAELEERLKVTKTSGPSRIELRDMCIEAVRKGREGSTEALRAWAVGAKTERVMELLKRSKREGGRA